MFRFYFLAGASATTETVKIDFLATECTGGQTILVRGIAFLETIIGAGGLRQRQSPNDATNQNDQP